MINRSWKKLSLPFNYFLYFYAKNKDKKKTEKESLKAMQHIKNLAHTFLFWQESGDFHF